MKTQDNNRWLLVSCVTIFLASLVMMGCEDTERQMTLKVTPQSSALPRAGDSVVLVASMPLAAASVTNSTDELLYPLEWSVSDSAAGIIISSTGSRAVYRCSVGGQNNIVTVRDQGEREGLANIN